MPPAPQPIAALLLALPLLPIAVRAEDPPTIPAARLIEDVEILRRVYEAAHPGLYRYNTKAQMDRNFAELRGRLDRDRTLGETYLAFSQFLAKLKCGHSYANFYNQPEETVRALFAGRNRVPFAFRWIGGRMIVTQDFDAPDRLKPGTEVVTLGGVPVDEILATLMTVARADGSNDAKRAAYLEVRGTSRYEAFDIFLPLFYPAIGATMDLTVRPPGVAEPVALRVEAYDLARREALAGSAKEPARDDDRPLWSFAQLDDRTSYLRMPGWALYNSRWDWKGFLDRGIDDLIDRRVPALIVDLRGNEGGLDAGNVLIERIADRAIRIGPSQRYTRYRELPKDFRPYLDTWDWSFLDWGDQAKEDRGGFFRLTRFDDDAQGDVIRPRGRRYEGRVVVLVDAANSSATFQFARLVKEHKLATLVGQATGGNRRGINGGAFFFVTLPNSRIEIDLPLIASFEAAGDRPDGERIPFADIPDAGVEPDLAVMPSADAIARGVDAELEAARGLLRPRGD